MADNLNRFHSDLESLSASALRTKYSKEASAYGAMKTRVRKATEDGSYRATLDPAWNDFRDFLRDIGPLPFESASLDRIDHTDPEYGPGKVRWADKKTQTRNRSNTRMVIWRGEEMPLAEYAERLGVTVGAARSAIIDRKLSPDVYARSRNSSDQADLSLGFIQGMQRISAEAVLAAYQEWKTSSVRRRSRKAKALPEVYFLHRAKLKIDALRERLETGGFFGCDTDEEREAHPDWPKYMMLRELLECSWRAKASLIQKEPDWGREPAFDIRIASRIRWLEESPEG